MGRGSDPHTPLALASELSHDPSQRWEQKNAGGCVGQRQVLGLDHAGGSLPMVIGGGCGPQAVVICWSDVVVKARYKHQAL